MSLAATLAVALSFISPGVAAANPKYSAIVIDANTGKTLFSSSANEARFPASLTKMMTLYMLFEAMEAGRVTKATQIPVSKYAASRPPTKIGFKPGQKIAVEAAILSLVTRSANDVAAAIGEFLGGSEAKFAQMMTNKARQLGMRNTTFRNASGLPNASQKTTAYDMALLGLALREHFPTQFRYFSYRSFKYRGQTIGNHNRLLGKVEGVDGIKTGYTNASGFNLVSTVNRDGRRIVAVVMGGRTGRSRDAHMTKLIEEYLPSASRKDGPPLIAARKSGNVTVAALDLPSSHEAPIPAQREEAVTSVEDIVTAYAPAETVRPEAFAAPVPATRVAVSVAETEEGSTEIDPVTTASAPRSGWIIQIGSLPSADAAASVLQKASTGVQAVLASASPYTETFVKGSTTYYRARFGGFESRNAAQKACNALKKNFSCYTLAR
ncbi:MAG: SPOR domain-containing protein [Phyllobacterium sp.]